MDLKNIKFVFFLIIFLLLVFYERFDSSGQVLSERVSPSPSITIEQAEKQSAQVIRVIDGDTIEVLLSGEKEKIRVIGIDAPEAVRPAECFGKEASNFARQILEEQTVSLESDPTQNDRDNYGRLLGYVFINNVDFGKFMIENGYAYEYTYDLPYKYQLDYKKAQTKAREQGIGLWSGSACVN